MIDFPRGELWWKYFTIENLLWKWISKTQKNLDWTIGYEYLKIPLGLRWGPLKECNDGMPRDLDWVWEHEMNQISK